MNLIINNNHPTKKNSNLPKEWASFASLIRSTYHRKGKDLRQMIKELNYPHKRLLYIDE